MGPNIHLFVEKKEDNVNTLTVLVHRLLQRFNHTVKEGVFGKKYLSISLKYIRYVDYTPDDPRQRKLVITKDNELLGWELKIKLRDGLPLMEEDFR
ncbi:UDP-glucuronic acid decarboxylase 1 [Artemisia annua]|uniref:UDP-glucuronic acid decarboxylase 1 n=1 Tax=Artemisia annua TaxID=35608 RepID=A0A2U1PQ04_ARTAN|nr:UDP-glucuronic acid decarboxylase 1 [Artemisia annua]